MTDAEGVLRLHPVLGLMDDAALGRLAAAAHERVAEAGEVLVGFGEAGTVMYVIGEGQVEVLMRAHHGAELVLRVIGPGLDVGGLAVFDQGPAPSEYVAQGRTRLYGVAGTAIRDELLLRPDLLLLTASRMADYLRVLTASASDLAFLDVRRRLAKLVLAELDRSGGADERPRVRLAAHQAAAAARVGVTRQTFNRALGELVQRGWIAAEGAVVHVRDRAALERFVVS